ncbi:MAG TPA: cytosolic protein [Planctomycetes bacterium]|nr:cytosolic protein [Planctomycetota bacterium]
MESLDIAELTRFVNNNISLFHESKLERLRSLRLKDVLKKKNPYLFKAKNITLATELVTSVLDAFLSSSEEKIFGDFLEELAIFISERTCGGRKSTATGIDLEFENEGKRYIVSIKSGPNWGNNAQHRRQEQDFQTAVRVLRQARSNINIEPVLGICYGKVRTRHLRGYLKVVGQNFWYLISGEKKLYTDIIEPIGYRAKQHNDEFLKQKDKVVNLFTQQFLDEFCEEGSINWKKLVEFNSGNFDLNKRHV